MRRTQRAHGPLVGELHVERLGQHGALVGEEAHDRACQWQVPVVDRRRGSHRAREKSETQGQHLMIKVAVPAIFWSLAQAPMTAGSLTQ